jgi:hypothetical protein
VRTVGQRCRPAGTPGGWDGTGVLHTLEGELQRILHADVDLAPANSLRPGIPTCSNRRPSCAHPRCRRHRPSAVAALAMCSVQVSRRRPTPLPPVRPDARPLIPVSPRCPPLLSTPLPFLPGTHWSLYEDVLIERPASRRSPAYPERLTAPAPCRSPAYPGRGACPKAMWPAPSRRLRLPVPIAGWAAATLSVSLQTQQSTPSPAT